MLDFRDLLDGVSAKKKKTERHTQRTQKHTHTFTHRHRERGRDQVDTLLFSQSLTLHI